jgi:hypothetical protein
MPVGLLTLRTATPPELVALHDRPDLYYEYVNDVVTRAGATLVDLYFDAGAELAYAIVESLDDYLDVKAVSRILGAEGFTKMIRKDQVTDAISRAERYRGEPPSPS